MKAMTVTVVPSNAGRDPALLSTRTTQQKITVLQEITFDLNVGWMFWCAERG